MLTRFDREYKKVPSHLKDDKVIPSVSDIPSFLSSIRHPNKNRAISVGPQSEADAYEAMAFREKRRKESTSSAKASGSIKRRQTTPGEDSVEYFDRAKSIIRLNGVPVTGLLPTPNPSRLDLYEDMMAAGPAICTPITPDDETGLRGELVRTASQDRRQDEKENREMFSRIEKPRVRYDVEVVTKLIVYAGEIFQPSCIRIPLILAIQELVGLPQKEGLFFLLLSALECVMMLAEPNWFLNRHWKNNSS